jgi:hypothetical protein
LFGVIGDSIVIFVHGSADLVLVALTDESLSLAIELELELAPILPNICFFNNAKYSDSLVL